MNRVVLCLTETRLPDWRARRAYLKVKMDQERQEAERASYAIYGLDLIWLLVKRYYPGAELDQPSSLHEKRNRRIDQRSAEEIRQDILRKLG